MSEGPLIAWRSFARWLKFNLVGVAGVLIQLTVLHAATSHLGYMAATALAVESALLHNFAWHCVCTWRDRFPDRRDALPIRFLRFQFSNGAVSLAGNMILMRLLVGRIGIPPLIANGIAILVCSLINFILGDRFVFPEASS